MDINKFSQTILEAYQSKGDYITIGAASVANEIQANHFINLPLKTINRHGLIAGATGTGKTKTIQVLSEQLSAKGIPVLMMDIKGDFSGIAQPGTLNDFIEKRHSQMNLGFEPQGFPVELMSISYQNGVKLRATVSEFGPILFSRILDLNETQAGIVSIIFKYCDDKKLPLLDLKDFKKTLQYLTNEAKSEIEAEYGRISTASTGAIMRKLIEIEQQGGDNFFGEPSFNIEDLMRIDDRGYGFVNILRLTDIQDKPKLFSTFMLNLLAQIYSQMPEQGDSGQPELVIFIDEAHLIFNEATKTLLNQIETIVKLIRSKGIGLYFITQNPTDIPEGVLAQLGLKIQHALRAFTEKDRKAIKSASENFPRTEFYKTDEVITQLGTGEALVTALNEKGIPTPLVVCTMRAPMSRMDVLSQEEIDAIIARSPLAKKYNPAIDRESAYEILTEKLNNAEKELEKEDNSSTPLTKTTQKSSAKSSDNTSDVTKSILKVVTSATFIRGAFGILNKFLSSNNNTSTKKRR